ncbi:hypothetical protein M8C13_36365 [Crossiella sp. SN42]|uniref:hypothetical protein n=1 Tax=Crossiella sp. SN42 TaxID=2944808 RepID=UPI00207D1A4B|nr:hypothetical protein [Crossiella sp. SN42]MCO1581239.1 hypothetical protein [Crossiella sp. SN42]
MSKQEWLSIIWIVEKGLIERARDIPSDSWATYSELVDRVWAMAVSAGGHDPAQAVVNRLRLSFNLIDRVSARADGSLLDPGHAVKLFLRSLPMSVDEAAGRAAHWQSADISVIRELRRIKNMVTPVLAIVDIAPDADPGGDVKPWRELHPALP